MLFVPRQESVQSSTVRGHVRHFVFKSPPAHLMTNPAVTLGDLEGKTSFRERLMFSSMCVLSAAFCFCIIRFLFP